MASEEETIGDDDVMEDKTVSKFVLCHLFVNYQNYLFYFYWISIVSYKLWVTSIGLLTKFKPGTFWEFIFSSQISKIPFVQILVQ